MLVKVKVTNNAPGLQGIRHVGGVTYLQPGASRTLEFDEATGRRTARLLFLSFESIEQVAPPEPPVPVEPVKTEETEGVEPSAAAALLAGLEAEGLHFQTFKKRAGEILGPDALPDTKDEIVAALKALG